MHRWLVLALVFAPPCGIAQTVYKCETADGIEFSSMPCADDAEKLEIETRSANRERMAADNGPAWSPEDFSGVVTRSMAQVIELVGRPAATYIDDGIDHWLYPNGCRPDPEPVCVELLFQNDRSFQITWIPEEIMRENVRIARGFADWLPPTEVRDKSFAATGTDVRGLPKTRVVGRFGQPDVKKVFDGTEIWEYKRVPIAPGDPDMVVVYVYFDGDTVSQVVAN